MKILKSKVTHNALAEWATEPDSFGNRLYDIKFENKDEGWFRTKNPEYFKVGEEAYYIKDVKDKPDGTGSNTWIKRPTKDQMEAEGLITGPAQTGSKGGSLVGGKPEWKPKRKADYLAEAASYSMLHTMGFVGSDSPLAKELIKKIDDIPELYSAIYNRVKKNIDEIEGLE